MDTIMQTETTSSTRTLSEFLAAIRFEDIPPVVIERTEELFLDWFASTLAGKDARPTRIMENFAAIMGPREGDSEILVSRKRTSAMFAALISLAALGVAGSLAIRYLHSRVVFWDKGSAAQTAATE